MKKGFTLIELLIVIAIIGILASALLVSFGGARQSARDARRLSDLRQVQAALELYFNKSGNYPLGVMGSSWGSLETTLTTAGIGVTRIPNDPVTGRNYRYASFNTEQQYILGAGLDQDNAARTNNASCPTTYNGDCICSPNATTLFPYCVGL